jgi:GNAT superfamily N-acetyltransferase
MADLVIRIAQPDDFGPVARLLERLGRPTVTPRNRAAVKEVFNAQLTDPSSSHLVAVTGRDRVIGFCSLHFRTRLNHDEPQAWIGDVIVDEGERGRGVARALLGEAERRARERGCSDVVLESSYNRKEDHLLYVGAGMTDAGRFFRKRLD